MKKFGIHILMLLLATTVLAQDKMSLFSRMNQKNILNHMDVGVNVGTVGIGIDVALPVGDYVRIRAGYNYVPRFNLHSKFPVETRSGGRLSSFIDKIGNIDAMLPPFVDLNLPYFTQEKELMEMYKNGDLSAKDYVGMDMKPNLHQFKFLVDVMPFKNNKHWSFTAGFFVGPSTVGDAISQQEETAILKAVNLYNSRYYHDLVVLHGMSFTFIEADGSLHDVGVYAPIRDFVTSNGLAGFPLGYFADGEKAMMVPGADNTVRAEMKVNKFRPYLGFGYNTHLSRNKKWKLNVDAGVLFLCGNPKVYVDNVYKFDASPLELNEDNALVGKDTYVKGVGTDVQSFDGGKTWNYYYYGETFRYSWDGVTEQYIECGNLQNHVDLVNDLHDIPGKVGDMVNTISKFKVYPNLSVTFSYRLF